MSVTQQLYYAFKDAGLLPITGYNSHHMFNWRDAPFTVFMKDGTIFGSKQAGLALQEVMFLENLAEFLNPANCLVIGNGMGWSTVATAMAFPKAKTIAIDIEDEAGGIGIANDLFKQHGLNGGAMIAKSPDDVAKVCEENFDAPPEFVLIDAMHTVDAMLRDFEAVANICGENSVYLFHDVINWKMIPAFNAIIEQSDFSGRLLTKTPSGMAIVFAEGNVSDDFVKYVDMFSDDPDVYKNYRAHIDTSMDQMQALYHVYK